MNKEAEVNTKSEQKKDIKKIFKSIFIIAITISVGFLVGVAGSSFFLGTTEENMVEESEVVESTTEEAASEQSVESTVLVEEEQQPLYLPAEYDFKIDEITVEIEGLTRGYDIAVVNDLHLITDMEAGDVLEEHLPTVTNRYNNFAVTSDGVHADELWPEIIKFLNYYNFDGVVFAGDMLDYCSHSNMETLSEGINNLKYPKEKIMYIRSDHDYGGWYGGSVFTDADGFTLQAEFLDGDNGENCIEFEEFQIVGVNKSYQNLSEGRLSFLTEKMNEGKPVIMVTHVPFYSEEDSSLETFSMEKRNRIYYWNEENSTYCPDVNTQKFIDDMYDVNSNVVQLLAAHVHASWDGVVANDLKQHIFAPAYEGRIGIVHVIAPKENDEVKK